MLTGPDFREEHVLNDGTRVVLRHIRPEDEAELKRGFEHLSSSSRYRRFQGLLNELSPGRLYYLTHVDGHDHVAIVAEAEDGKGLGVARLVRSESDPRLAEVALTVADEMQRKGLGRTLGVAIARAAKERGIDRLTGPILSDNHPIRSLLDEVGATLQTTTDGLTFEISLDDDGAREGVIDRILRAFSF